MVALTSKQQTKLVWINSRQYRRMAAPSSHPRQMQLQAAIKLMPISVNVNTGNRVDFIVINLLNGPSYGSCSDHTDAY